MPALHWDPSARVEDESDVGESRRMGLEERPGRTQELQTRRLAAWLARSECERYRPDAAVLPFAAAMLHHLVHRLPAGSNQLRPIAVHSAETAARRRANEPSAPRFGASPAAANLISTQTAVTAALALHHVVVARLAAGA
ncbi:hypothetical protein ACN47E_004725 [Coniothyrium glycines]